MNFLSKISFMFFSYQVFNPSVYSLVVSALLLNGKCVISNHPNLLFRWKDHFSAYTNKDSKDGLCRMCELLHTDSKRKVYPDLYEWFGKNQCLSAEGNNDGLSLEKRYPYLNILNLLNKTKE